jgi:hypothetical protein
MAPTIAFTPDFIDACRNLWRDGFDKGVDGTDDYPDFTVFFNNIKHSSTKATKEEPNYAEMEKLPFNKDQCEARVEKYGYAVQCTRTPKGGCLCGLHQNMLDNLPDGATDLRYGRFNQPRPEKDFYKGEIIKWDGATRKSRGGRKNKDVSAAVPKLKMGEMRDYLTSRIPVDDFRGLKKQELTELYLKVKEKENTTSSEEENTPPAESPKKEEKLPESTKSSESSESTDDGAGVGLHLIPETPKTVAEYKQLFKELSIETDGLRGLRAYKQAYQDYIRKKEEENEKTQPMSDEEEDDIGELQEDKHSYEETDFEGVSYLEDEESGKIYNLRYQHVGKWNEDVDDIIWISDEFRLNHESARQ